jgi:holo-[acyl-carrier protein] synthase
MLRCGIDTLEIERVARSLERFGERFLRRFFTPQEQADCGGQPHRLAARIAAKEAVAKALGTGIGAVRWVDIEVRSAPSGRPMLHLHGQAAAVAAELGLTEWDISLSHSREVASAMCVAR